MHGAAANQRGGKRSCDGDVGARFWAHDPFILPMALAAYLSSSQSPSSSSPVPPWPPSSSRTPPSTRAASTRPDAQSGLVTTSSTGLPLPPLRSLKPLISNSLSSRVPHHPTSSPRTPSATAQTSLRTASPPTRGKTSTTPRPPLLPRSAAVASQAPCLVLPASLSANSITLASRRRAARR